MSNKETGEILNYYVTGPGMNVLEFGKASEDEQWAAYKLAEFQKQKALEEQERQKKKEMER